MSEAVRSSAEELPHGMITRHSLGLLFSQFGSSFGVDLADESSDWHNADVGTVPA